MNIKLRIINNQNIPVLPSLTGLVGDKLTTSVKGNILSHQEVDNNFSNIILYLKTIVDVLMRNSNKLDQISIADIDNLRNLSDTLAETLNNVNTNKDDIKVIKDNISNIRLELDRKVENIKIINGHDIRGEGSITLNINQSQFLDHLTNIGFGEVGCICLLKSSKYLQINNIYSASSLHEENINNLQGSWRCLGKISDNHGLFQRLV